MKIQEDQEKAIRTNFGIWLRARRDSLQDKPIQREIARRAGLSRSHYSQIESGVRSTTVNSAIKIARALGYTSDDDIAEVVKLAGLGDLRDIKPVIVDITGRGRNLGAFTAAGDNVEIPAQQLEAIVHAIGMSAERPAAHQAVIDQRIGRIEVELQEIKQHLRTLVDRCVTKQAA